MGQLGRVRQRAASRLGKTSGSRRSQSRAGAFRARYENTRLITILDAVGAKRFIKKRGHLNVTAHSDTLTALEQRALRFLSRRQTQLQNDEDLIAEALEGDDADNSHSFINTWDRDSNELEEIRSQLEQHEELLRVLGTAPGVKADGIVRLVYENVNGLPARLGNNGKLDKIKTLLDDLNADIFALNEHRNNINHRQYRHNGINQLFYGGEAMVRGIWGYNKHENMEGFLQKQTLEGGTALVAYGELAGYMDPSKAGTDSIGLGRWTYMEFKGGMDMLP